MKRIKTNLLLFIAFLFALPSKEQVSKVAGIYSDKYAVYGFFARALKLNSDMTFEYEWGGDEQSDRGIGNYKINGDTILLTFIHSKYDTLFKFYWDSIVTIYSMAPNDSGGFHLSAYHSYDTIKKPGYTLSPYINDRPTKFLYRHSNLYYLTDKGTISNVKHKVPLRHRKFIFFGSSWGMRKNHLIKRTASWDNFW